MTPEHEFELAKNGYMVARAEYLDAQSDYALTKGDHYWSESKVDRITRRYYRAVKALESAEKYIGETVGKLAGAV